MMIMFISNPPYYTYMSSFDQLERTQKIELLMQSIETKPDFVYAHNDLAWFYALEGENLDEAMRLIEVALGANPDNEAFWDTKAEIYYQLGEYDKAIAIEQVLIRKNPTRETYKKQLNKFKTARINEQLSPKK